MNELLYVELQALYDKWVNFAKLFNKMVRGVFGKLPEVLPDIVGPNVDSLRVEDNPLLTAGVLEIINAYNRLVLETRSFLSRHLGNKISEEVLPKPVYVYIHEDEKYGKYINVRELVGALYKVSIDGSSTLRLISSLLGKISLTPEEEKELTSLEKMIEELIEPKLPKYAEDLKEAIREFRQGHFLASSLISGRVIMTIYDKIKKRVRKEYKHKDSKDAKEEKIIEKFIEEKMGGKENSRLLKAIRDYRNRYSHEIGSRPRPSEALIMLSGAVELVDRALRISLLQPEED